MRFLCLVLFTSFAVPSAVWAGFIDYPTVRLQALDKSTARTVTLEAKVGTTIEYGSIYIKVQSCRKSEPLDKPESASFIQIWEVPLNAKKSEWVFSGWMFASSPALSAMDHPVYDVWVLDCIDSMKENNEAKARKIKTETVDQDDLEKPKAEEKPEDQNMEDEASKPRIVIEESDDFILEKNDIQSDESFIREDEALNGVIEDITTEAEESELIFE